MSLKEGDEVYTLVGFDWVKGVVKKITGDKVKILREDGSIRALNKNSTEIKQKDDLNLTFDKDNNLGYNSDMEDITLPRFNVVIPKGSNSLKIEKALIPSTREMNKTALKVNVETWKTNKESIKEKFLQAEEACHKEAGKKFKIGSPKDCGEILFKGRGHTIQKTTKTGAASVNKEVLTALSRNELQDPLPALIITARESRSKLSQLEAWEPYAKEGFVQSKWDSLGQPHGRYTSEDPNLQNRILEIRETIEAAPGNVFLSADLGQAEYVTWASLSKDETLSETFRNGQDLHERMYKEISETAGWVENLGIEPRKFGKTTNFALLYLMREFVFANQLQISAEQAKKIYEIYLERAKTAIDYRDEYLKKAQRTGRTETKFGRIRDISDIKSATGNYLHELNKTAWHHHNAGTAAELLKIKQAQCYKALREKFSFEEVRIALNMFDELIFEVKEENLHEVQGIVEEVFNREIKGFLPFTVDVRVGSTWGETSK